MPDPLPTQIRDAVGALVGAVTGITTVKYGRAYPDFSEEASAFPTASLFWETIESDLTGGKDRRHTKTGTLHISVSGAYEIALTDTMNAVPQVLEEFQDLYSERIENAIDASPTLSGLVERIFIASFNRQTNLEGSYPAWNLLLQVSIQWTHTPA